MGVETGLDIVRDNTRKIDDIITGGGGRLRCHGKRSSDAKQAATEDKKYGGIEYASRAAAKAH
jgi:hypothetical protein